MVTCGPFVDIIIDYPTKLLLPHTITRHDDCFSQTPPCMWGKGPFSFLSYGNPPTNPNLRQHNYAYTGGASHQGLLIVAVG